MESATLPPQELERIPGGRHAWVILGVFLCLALFPIQASAWEKEEKKPKVKTQVEIALETPWRLCRRTWKLGGFLEYAQNFLAREGRANGWGTLAFIAVDARFAPVKSLIEHAMALDIAEHIHLYWIATPGNSHYLGNLCRSWVDALDNFHYTALKTSGDTTVAELLPGITGDLDSVAAHDCYVCAPAPLLDGIQTYLHDAGLPRSQLRLEPVREEIS